MAEIRRNRNASFSYKSRLRSNPGFEEESRAGDDYPQLNANRFMGSPSPQSRPGISATYAIDDEDVRKAASLLLSKFGLFLSSDICECCYSTFKSRLTLIASGECSGQMQPNNRQSLGAAHGVSPMQQYSSSPTHCDEDSKTVIAVRSAINSTMNGTLSKPQRSDKRGNITENTGVTAQKQENNEDLQMKQVLCKKDYCIMEIINGKRINILQGLELHRNVLNEAEQKELVKLIYHYRELGRNQKLRRRTFSEPKKWMRGKGRVTIQFGCCYNYATDKDGNPPGIIRDEEVDEIPEQIRMIIMRLVRWNVLPSSCIPDSCIVNIYDVGDCIPPHIDHHDFLRPFCTLSLLSECNIVFGSNLKIIGPGEFEGSIAIPLPTGSVFILNGNGADIAKHAVPAVPTKRISITFRKMDPTKVPYSFKPDMELLSITDGKSHSALSHAATTDKSIQSFNRASFLSDNNFPALEKPVHDDNLPYSRAR